jgi:hypothetical protein
VYNVDDLIHAIVEDVKKTFRLHEALDHERCEPMDPSTSSMKSVTVCCRYAYLIPRFSADGIANKIVPRNERDAAKSDLTCCRLAVTRATMCFGGS